MTLGHGASTDLRTPVCDRLGCDLPIVLAGMGGVARSELVVAVTNAGAFGFLGMVRESPTRISKEIAAVRAGTGRPFGVNLIPAATDADLFEAELRACLDARVHAVALFWDLSRQAVERLRAEGVVVVCQVGSPEEAQAAADAGADILIAQGVEAGGHVRGRTPRDELLAAILSAVDLPVLAAGGLANGRDLAQALERGAQGAVFGTAFLATEESFAHAFHKQRVVDAAGETVLTRDFHINWPAGAAVRVLPNSVTHGERGDPFRPEREVVGADGNRSIYLFSTDSPLRTTTGDLEAMALYAGEGAAEIRAVVPAADRVRVLAAEAVAALAEADAASAREASSPVCYGEQASDLYMGFASPEELAQELNILLEAERAGAQVAASLVAEAPDGGFRALAKVIRADEVRWCRALRAALAALPGETSDKVGDFYDKAMAIAGPQERLAFVNRGQGWVVRRLRTLLPRVRDDALHKVLLEMLAAHERNIETAEAALADRGGA